jgi:hypothetical protein
VPEKIMKQVLVQNQATLPLMNFLVGDIASIPMSGPHGLIKRAGLPTRGPVL